MTLTSVVKRLLCAGLLFCLAFFNAQAQYMPFPLPPPFPPVSVCLTCSESCVTKIEYGGPGVIRYGVCHSDGADCGHRPVKIGGIPTPIGITCNCSTTPLPLQGKYVVIQGQQVYVAAFYCVCW